MHVSVNQLAAAVPTAGASLPVPAAVRDVALLSSCPQSPVGYFGYLALVCSGRLTEGKAALVCRARECRSPAPATRLLAARLEAALGVKARSGERWPLVLRLPWKGSGEGQGAALGRAGRKVF